MPEINVTELVEVSRVDDEHLPLLKCVCGERFADWHHILSIYPDMAADCPTCGRRFIFKNTISIFEV